MAFCLRTATRMPQPRRPPFLHDPVERGASGTQLSQDGTFFVRSLAGHGSDVQRLMKETAEGHGAFARLIKIAKRGFRNFF